VEKGSGLWTKQTTTNEKEKKVLKQTSKKEVPIGMGTMKSRRKPHYTPPSNEEFARRYGSGEKFEIEAITKEEFNGLHVIHFALDASPSMAGEFPHLVDAVNEVSIPALKGVKTADKKAMRLSCSLFSGRIVPSWLGYRSPWQLGKEQLNESTFKSAGYDYTHLYEAIIEGRRSIDGAMRCYKSQNRMAREKEGLVVGRLLVFTDGANYSPTAGVQLTPNDVRRELTRNNGYTLRTVLVYFETGGGIKESEIKNLALNQMGFKEVWYFGDKDTLENRRRAFRHSLNLWSSKSE